MWCTRWFIPLLILPLPSSPPYFLILFLISMIIHARPCFYCIILLTALFLSSCYWQPIPLTLSVSSSWGTNATFATALSAVLSTSPSVPLPAVIRLADRCWCDVSASRLFEPFDIARWERTSVEQLKEEVERDAASAEQLLSSDGQADLPNDPCSCSCPSTNNCTVESQLSASQLLSHTSALSTSPEASSTTDPANQSSTPQGPAEPPLPTGPPVTLFRRKYDLRSYGFSMILDLSWSRED